MSNGRYYKQLKGFSLLEVLMTMGILLMITIVVFPIAINKANKAKLDSYAEQLSADIYFQQQRSANRNLAEGIRLQANGYSLFDGASYSTATEVESKSFPANIRMHTISLTSGSEILFSQGEFKPTTYGTAIITDGTFSTRIYINAEGLIGYEDL
ncbi:hypothetical protein HYV12_02010 [Candidatus Dojkabacteria bacterium]|nr:hypothetical protein [Candidatus Dojkabacteria bacterium]